jgi:hypothetical protein
MVTCHGAPAFSRAFSKPMRRVSSSISPKAMPVVGEPKAPVPQTVTPRSAAAFRSNELFLAPVVMSNLRSGSASIIARGNGVRSRMPTITAKPCSALIASSRLLNGSL